MTKKNFTNPAMQFISDDKPSAKTTAKGIKYRYVAVEIKTRRVNLILRESLYEAVKKLSKITKVSLNEITHIALEKYLEAKGIEIEAPELPDFPLE